MKLISRKELETIYGDSNDTITFGLDRSVSRSHRFQRLISRITAALGHILLLNTIIYGESKTIIRFDLQ